MKHCATRRKVLGPIPGGALGHFQVTLSFLPHSAALGSTQPLTEGRTKVFPWGQIAAAILVVPNVEVRMEAQYSSLSLSLRVLIWETLLTL